MTIETVESELLSLHFNTYVLYKTGKLKHGDDVREALQKFKGPDLDNIGDINDKLEELAYLKAKEKKS